MAKQMKEQFLFIYFSILKDQNIINYLYIFIN